MAGVMWHLSDAWARRSEPNVLLIHYDDLTADLDGQMRRLAGGEILTQQEIAQYHARASQLAPPDLLSWLHRDGHAGP